MPLYKDKSSGDPLGAVSLFSFDPGSDYLKLDGSSAQTSSYPKLAGKPGFEYNAPPNLIDGDSEVPYSDPAGGIALTQQNYNGSLLFKYNATEETLRSSDDGGQIFNTDWTVNLPAAPLVGLMYNKLNTSSLLMVTATELYELDVSGPSTSLLTSLPNVPSGVFSAWRTMSWAGNRLAITNLGSAPISISVSAPGDLSSFSTVNDTTNTTGYVTSIAGEVGGALMVAYDSGYDVAPVTRTTDFSTFSATAAGELDPGQSHYIANDLTVPLTYVNTPGVIGVSVDGLSTLAAPAGAAPFPLDTPVSVVPNLSQFGWIQTTGFVGYTFDGLVTNLFLSTSSTSVVKDASYVGGRISVADVSGATVYSYKAERPVSSTFLVYTLVSPDPTFDYYVRSK